MVDDPSQHLDIFKTEKAQEKERQRLFKIIEDLVKWENTSNEKILQLARDEIWQSWRYTCAENADNPRAKELFDRYVLPAFHDPFAGGGALPLEAQRLGLESFASDLNPVAVLINKAMIELPPHFRGISPVNPRSQAQRLQMDKKWSGLHGLAEDIKYYGARLTSEAKKEIGKNYSAILITEKLVAGRPDLKKYEGQQLTVIAWVWARTVTSPNPAFANIHVPLASSFMLSTKVGKEVYVEPFLSGNNYSFVVKIGRPANFDEVKNGTKLARGANFKCLLSGTPITGEHIKSEGKAGRMGSRMLAIVAEGDRGRVYLPPLAELEVEALNLTPVWVPDTLISGSTQYLGVKPYGIERFDQLFTSRQLVALTTFADLVSKIKTEIEIDSIKLFGEDGCNRSFDHTSYANSIAIYLTFAINKLTDRGSMICGWDSSRESLRNTFGRQAIPMSWDYAEANPFSDSSGSYENAIDQVVRVVAEYLPANYGGYSQQADASNQSISLGKVISTDPPYYDNIPYADLSDFFYVWLRRALKDSIPDLFSTLAVPKTEELVAFAYRHKDGKRGAETFFLDGMTKAMHRLAELSHPAFPLTIYYAFKQAESNDVSGTTNTGWDTFLAAVIKAGFEITGTWPMRTELANKLLGVGSNMLASSIVLVCRARSVSAPRATRREFVSALKVELPASLKHLQAGNIAPVDLAQAAIGPGMGIYTRYSDVIDVEGNSLSVRAALALINQTLDEALAEQEGDFDEDSRWALTWFEQFGFGDGEYGVAEQLSKSKNTALGSLVEVGIIASKSGKVRLLKPNELNSNWDPSVETRLTIWEIVHQLIRALESGGEGAAGAIAAKLGSHAETARELCYRLYTLCERKRRATDAMAYNGLVQSWPEITRLASEVPTAFKTGTTDLFEQE
jgi:putative DNA methylase